MLRFTRLGWCFASVTATVLLVVSFRKHGPDPASATPSINEWSIPELTAHLNRMGVDVHWRAMPKNGPLGRAAYLTTTAKEWKELNSLCKDPKRIQEWRGILYCERIGDNDKANLYLLEQWAEDCLVVEPFIFYGDPELLKRVRNALASTATPTTP